MSDYRHLSLLTCVHEQKIANMMSPNLKVRMTSYVSSMTSHDQ